MMAEVLKPELLRLGNFCYRVNAGDSTNTDSSMMGAESQDVLERRDFHEADEPESMRDMDERIRVTDSGSYTAALTIPSSLFKFLIGKGGETKRKLEYETRCSITIPGRGQEGAVKIKGELARQVSSAITRIEVLTESGRSKLPFTHFLSIPANHETVLSAFQEFSEDVMYSFSKVQGVDKSIFHKSIFQTSSKLHMTLGTMTLLNDAEVDRATQTLHDCSEGLKRILGADSKLKIYGLDYMNDDPSAVDVLYAKVSCLSQSSDSTTDRLQNAVNHLTSAFSTAGLLNNDFDRTQVKLHITLMNTLFRKERSGTDKPRSKSERGNRETFNAKPILETMRRFDFGEIYFPGFHLSKRHSTACDGYYLPVTTILRVSSSSSSHVEPGTQRKPQS